MIPCASSPGLQCLDWQNVEVSFLFLFCSPIVLIITKWADLEDQPENEVHDIVAVLCGETLARLTCNYYQGTVHRVVFCVRIKML